MAPRTPLLHPRTYFEDRGFDLAPAAGAVGAAALALVLVFVGFGVVLSNRLSSAGHGAAADEVWSVFGGYVFGIVVALFVGWFIMAGVLHVLARAVVSHHGSFGETLAVVGWGSAPSVLSAGVAFVFLATAVGDASMASPDAFAADFRAELASTTFARNVVSFLVTGWQTYIFASGVSVAFEDYSGAAWLVSGFVAYGAWLLSVF